MSHDSPPDPVSPGPSEEDPAAPAKRPWWTYAVPYPGRIPSLDRHQWRVLGLLAVAELFDHYDMGILSFTLCTFATSFSQTAQ